MKLNQKKACSLCPFLKASVQPKVNGWLGKERAEGIIDSLQIGDVAFPCHKTSPCCDDDYDEDEARTLDFSNTEACVGAIIMMAKNNNATQLVRIANRISGYNPKALLNQSDVVDSSEEFISQHTRKKNRDK